MKNIVIIAGNGFEDSELLYPKYRLMEAGYTVHLATPHKACITGKHGYKLEADFASAEIHCKDYVGVIIPGGLSPDNIRMNDSVLEIVRGLHRQGGLVAAICHGGSVLASAKIVKNVELTSYCSIQDDLKNAGAKWVDQEVVISDNIITSRQPEDLPAFMKACLNFLDQHASLETDKSEQLEPVHSLGPAA